MINMQEVNAEVERRARERMADLFPLLIEKIGKRSSFAGCRKHDVLRGLYVSAQVEVTRAKRHYRNSGSSPSGDSRLNRALDERDKIQKEYRSTPCTCWVKRK